jgi:dihydrolipoamide dehydrogenase
MHLTNTLRRATCCRRWGSKPAKALDVAQLMVNKDNVVAKLTGGVAALFQGNGVVGLPGFGSSWPDGKLNTGRHDGDVRCSGETRNSCAGIGTRGNSADAAHRGLIVDRPERSSSNAVPKRLGVIGAGVIGLELGSVWSRLGSERRDARSAGEMLPMVDARLARDARRIFEGTGVSTSGCARVTGSSVKDNTVTSTIR